MAQAALTQGSSTEVRGSSTATRLGFPNSRLMTGGAMMVGKMISPASSSSSSSSKMVVTEVDMVRDNSSTVEVASSSMVEARSSTVMVGSSSTVEVVSSSMVEVARSSTVEVASSSMVEVASSSTLAGPALPAAVALAAMVRVAATICGARQTPDWAAAAVAAVATLLSRGRPTRIAGALAAARQVQTT